jgi:hypothetical protein
VDRRATQPLAHQAKVGQGDFDSSDAVRSAAPLLHAKHVAFDTPLKLELGGELPSVTITYETYGQLDEAGGNAVLICHAISGDSHVARHDDADFPGWWDIVVGPGRFIDTDRYVQPRDRKADSAQAAFLGPRSAVSLSSLASEPSGARSR